MKLKLLLTFFLVGCSGSPVPPFLSGSPEASTPPWATAPSATVAPVQFPDASVPEADVSETSTADACSWECMPAANLLVNTCTGGAELDCKIVQDRCGYLPSWCPSVCQVMDPVNPAVNYPCTSPGWTWFDSSNGGTTYTCDMATCPAGSPCFVNVPGNTTPLAGICQIVPN